MSAELSNFEINKHLQGCSADARFVQKGPMPEHDCGALAAWIGGEECGAAPDGLYLGPTDFTLLFKALRALAASRVTVSPTTGFEAA